MTHNMSDEVNAIIPQIVDLEVAAIRARTPGEVAAIVNELRQLLAHALTAEVAGKVVQDSIASIRAQRVPLRSVKETA